MQPMKGRNAFAPRRVPVSTAVKTAALVVEMPGFTGLPIFASKLTATASFETSASRPPTMRPSPGQASW
jgi:hypothetical protein